MKILLQSKYPFDCPHGGRLHSHPFWQLDYYENLSKGKLDLEDGSLRVDKSCAMLIPPYVQHSILTYSNCICYAIKFEAEEEKFQAIKTCLLPYCEYEKIFDGMLSLMPARNDIEKEMLESYLNILLLSVKQNNGFFDNGGKQRDKRISAAINYIEENLLNDLTPDMLADFANMSTTHFTRMFRDDTGLAPMSYVRTLKIKKAAKMLRFSDFNISQIADALRYPDLHTFSRSFKKEMGCSPRQYREKEFSKNFQQN